MRLRHHDGALVAWEEKGTPLTLKLVRRGNREAVFEGIEDGKPLRLTYRRTGRPPRRRPREARRARDVLVHQGRLTISWRSPVERGSSVPPLLAPGPSDPCRPIAAPGHGRRRLPRPRPSLWGGRL